MKFEEATEGPVDLLVIAGEHSGDEHAARWVREARTQQPELSVYALGGPALRRAGATLLVDMMPHAIVGFWEVLKSYRFFKQLLNETVVWIKKKQPKQVLLVDYPGFNLRLAQALYDAGISKKGGGTVEVQYYIAPQIWAWKAKRRFEMARTLDGLSVIFPFEVDCFKDTDLPVRFVGHPFLSPGYQAPMEYDPQGVLLLLPGSREAAVRRIFPALLKAYKEVLKRFPKKSAVVLYPNFHLRDLLESLIQKHAPTLPIELLKVGVTVQASAVIMSSGTVSLHCALAGIPGVIVYKAHPFTYFLGKHLIQIPYLGIANLLLKKALYPEYIQNAASPKALATYIGDIFQNPNSYRQEHLAAADSLRNCLRA